MKKEIEINIEPNQIDTGYATALNEAIKDLENGNVITFTMEEFMAYSPVEITD